VTYAASEYWDRYLAERGLDWGGRWTDAFIPLLLAEQARSVLELGCGLGHDAARLADAGLIVVAADFSREAIRRARNAYGASVEFVIADVSEPLPFEDGSFDAVMANVSLHMFGAATTHAVFGEVRRVLRPRGLFVFHVNSTADRNLRAQRRPVERELEENNVLERGGQTVRFFSRDDLHELLGGWDDARLEHVEIDDAETGRVFKHVWRGIARSPESA